MESPAETVTFLVRECQPIAHVFGNLDATLRNELEQPDSQGQTRWLRCHGVLSTAPVADSCLWKT